MPSVRRLISSGSPFEQTMGYSRAVIQGDWCFVAGVTGYDYETMTLPGDAVAQTQNSFDTITNVLADARFEMSNLVRVQYTIVDRAIAATIAPILEHYLGNIRPAATMVIADLINPEMKVEIEVTAFKG